jgi:hypothetical protein
MKKWLIPSGAALVLFLAIAGGAFALSGGFDDDSDGGRESTLADEEGDNSGGDALGVCISEDDPNYDPEQPCDDTVVEGEDGDTPVEGEDTSLNICIEGVVTCNDTVVDGSDADADAIGGGEEGKARAIDAARQALATMGGPADAGLTSAHAVEWGNACLGVDDPAVACAEVITPGWIVVFEGGSAIYEFHTDLNGNAVYAPQ